jgi:hypothetical protein
MAKKKTTSAPESTEDEAIIIENTTAPKGRGDGWAKATEEYVIPVSLAKFWLGNKLYDMRSITKTQLEFLAKKKVISKKES